MKIVSYCIIELYKNYEEIFFLDECYIWNNKKNGTIYTWANKNERAFLYDETINQIKVGIEIAISNKGRIYY